MDGQVDLASVLISAAFIPESLPLGPSRKTVWELNCRLPKGESTTGQSCPPDHEDRQLS